MKEKAELKDRLREALEVREKKAIDLAKDLGIPKSAISQYLSGYRTIKDSKRIYVIAKYLDVSEAWLMGYDVPMARTFEKTNDTITDIVVRLRTDSEFLSVVEKISKLDSEQLRGLSAFIK